MAGQLTFDEYSELLPVPFWQLPLPVARGRCLRLGAHTGEERPQVFDKTGVCSDCHASDVARERCLADRCTHDAYDPDCAQYPAQRCCGYVVHRDDLVCPAAHESDCVNAPAWMRYSGEEVGY